MLVEQSERRRGWRPLIRSPCRLFLLLIRAANHLTLSSLPRQRHRAAPQLCRWVGPEAGSRMSWRPASHCETAAPGRGCWFALVRRVTKGRIQRESPGKGCGVGSRGDRISSAPPAARAGTPRRAQVCTRVRAPSPGSHEMASAMGETEARHAQVSWLERLRQLSPPSSDMGHASSSCPSQAQGKTTTTPKLTIKLNTHTKPTN